MMKTPFNAEQFIENLRSYNIGVFPMQIVFYILSLVVIYFTFRRSSYSARVNSAILAFLWLWMGIVYHLLYFTSINKAAYLFGGLFILQSLLFFFYGIMQNIFEFRFHYNRYGITGIVFILFALIIYPMLGYSFRHVYPDAPSFGLPCPTTIFTFGLMLISIKRIPPAILLIPFAWSILGFTAAFNFGIVEDTGLLVSGLIAVPMILLRNRKLKMHVHLVPIRTDKLKNNQ